MSTAINHWMTTRDAAAALGVIPRRVRKLIQDRELTSRRVGTQHLIPRADVDKLMKRRSGPPKSGSITPTAAAKQLGITASWARHLFRTGRIKGYKSRGKVYLYQVSVQAYASQAADAQAA